VEVVDRGMLRDDEKSNTDSPEFPEVVRARAKRGPGIN
jgi:hypothetical protein